MADPAADLEKIRHDHRQHVSVNFPAPGICVSRCADSQPSWPCGAHRAASAAMAVLKLADEADSVGWDIDPARVREAITRELTSEETTGTGPLAAPGTPEAIGAPAPGVHAQAREAARQMWQAAFGHDPQ